MFYDLGFVFWLKASGPGASITDVRVDETTYSIWETLDSADVVPEQRFPLSFQMRPMHKQLSVEHFYGYLDIDR